MQNHLFCSFVLYHCLSSSEFSYLCSDLRVCLEPAELNYEGPGWCGSNTVDFCLVNAWWFKFHLGHKLCDPFFVVLSHVLGKCQDCIVIRPWKFPCTSLLINHSSVIVRLALYTWRYLQHCEINHKTNSDVT
jgi:hypothetical protein